MLKILSRYVPVKKVLLIVAETCWITGVLSLLLGLHSRYFLNLESARLAQLALRICVVTLLCLISFSYNGLYDLSLVHDHRQLAIHTLQGFGSASIALGFLYLVVPSLMLRRPVVIVFACVGVLLFVGWRMLVGTAARLYRVPQGVLVIGTNDFAVEVVKTILERTDLNMEVVGFLGDLPDQIGVSLINPKVVGTHEQLEQIAAEHRVSRVVVALPDRRNKLPVRALLNLKLRGVIIDDAHSFYERVTGKIHTTALPPSWLIFSDGFSGLARKVRLKRLMDFALALASGILSLPAAVVVAIAIRIDSPGPALFRQERVGLRGRAFNLIKFRTMREDAESNGPQWSAEDDPRITRVGRFLRRMRLDELPQIWNVLVGDMSFVGPRPERPAFVALLRNRLPYYDERHNVRPGISGWAQVRYHYGASIEDAFEKLQYDLFYIKNLSLFLDFAILFETGKIVLLGKGR